MNSYEYELYEFFEKNLQFYIFLWSGNETLEWDVVTCYVSFAENVAVKDAISGRCMKFWWQNCFDACVSLLAIMQMNDSFFFY